MIGPLVHQSPAQTVQDHQDLGLGGDAWYAKNEASMYLLKFFSPVAEPLACAIHGVDVIQPKVGSEGQQI